MDHPGNSNGIGAVRLRDRLHESIVIRIGLVPALVPVASNLRDKLMAHQPLQNAPGILGVDP